MWQGEFLAGCEDLGTEALRAWIEQERVGLRKQLAWASRQLVDRARAAGDWRTAIVVVERWCQAQPYDDEAHRNLVETLQVAGKPAEAASRHAQFTTRLRNDLGSAPSQEFTRLGASLAPTHEPMRLGERGLLTPDLSGRSEALGRLQQGWRAAASGHGGVALILGEEGFGTVALEKLMDLAGFALVVLLVLARLSLPGWIENSAVFIVVLAVAAVIALWAGIRRRQRLSDLVDRLPGQAGERINSSLRAAAAGLRSLRLRSRIVLLVLTTALHWTASILVNHWLLAAFGIALPLSVSALLLVVLQIGVSTNLVPGTIGLFEFLCVETLALFDVPRDVALGFGLVLHLIVLTPPVTAVLVGAMGGFWVRGGRRR
jgi:hypothetical protein